MTKETHPEYPDADGQGESSPVAGIGVEGIANHDDRHYTSKKDPWMRGVCVGVLLISAF